MKKINSKTTDFDTQIVVILIQKSNHFQNDLFEFWPKKLS